jgi:hypothetical protein
MKRKPLKPYRPLPVRRVEQIHKSPKDYDRRDNVAAVEEGLKETEEDDMEKDYTRAEAMAEEILSMVIKDGIHAARITRTKPPVVEVYGITDEVIKITVDVE